MQGGKNFSEVVMRVVPETFNRLKLSGWLEKISDFLLESIIGDQGHVIVTGAR